MISFTTVFLLAASLAPVDQQGYAKLVSEQKGKVVVIDFWATWCEPCREELPRLVALQKRLKFTLITISADEPEQEITAAAFLANVGAPGRRYIKRAEDDQAFIDSVDKKWTGALPALFLYDSAGKLTATFIGESDPSAVESAVRKAMGRTSR